MKLTLMISRMPNSRIFLWKDLVYQLIAKGKYEVIFMPTNEEKLRQIGEKMNEAEITGFFYVKLEENNAR